MLEAIERLYGDFQERELPELIERAHDLKHIPGKALALIGMRRVGKTYLCYQRIKELLSAGTPRENILYLNFEDDRLFDFSLVDCQTILDVFYRDRPEKKNEPCYYEAKQGHRIDFVHKDANITVLIQVAWSLKNPATREREIRALKEAAKEFKQTQSIIVTLDEEWTSEDDEIQVIPLWKFLLMGTP